MADIKVNVFLVSRNLKHFQQAAYEPIRKETKLGQMELQIIFAFNQCQIPSTVGSIHKQTGFNKGQISVCLTSLLEKGYLEVVDDKKTQFDAYILSEKGKEVANKIEKNTAYGRRKLLYGFTKEEANQCKEYLERILKNAEDFDGKIKFK